MPAEDHAQPAGSAVGVVIVAHNPGDVLARAVSSAVEQAGETHVVLVDAESSDGSVQAAGAADPDLRVMRVANRGFSAGSNAGIAATTEEFVLLMNPDAELLEGALDALVERMRAEPRAGLVSAKLYNPDMTLQANAFGAFPSLAVAVGTKLRRLGQRLAGNVRLSPREFQDVLRPDWVTGACVLARREAFERVGLLDESFFLYYEDVDWSHRMRDAGWDVLVEPSARAVHHLGTSDAPSGFAACAYRESFYRYAEKYHLWGLRALGRAFAAGRGLGGSA